MHELRNPLTIMKGEIEFALKKDNSLKNYKNVLISNLEEVNRISLITENMSLFLKYKNGDAILCKKPLNLEIFIKNVTDSIRILLVQNKIILKTFFENKVLINADEMQLKLFFINFLKNIIKYTSEKNYISLKCRKRNNNAIIQIITKSYNIFHEHMNSYNKSNKNINNEYHSLILQLNKYIIDAHSGSFTIEKKSNQETLLTVSIPL